MLVDHWINFNGCDHHAGVRDGHITGMKEFIKDRQRLFERIPEFSDPDFAQIDRLPAIARLPGDDDEIEDDWRKLSSGFLSHMSADEWRKCHETIGKVFTGGDDSDDEDGTRLDRYLEVGKDDAIFANSREKREMARGEVSIDVDSVLALFTDLSMINTMISISVIANPMKNLKKSVHVTHNGVPLHRIPHFHLGEFGHDPTFDLYMFLPAMYNRNRKRRNNQVFNHVSEELRAMFMNECLLPAIREVMDSNRSQGWDFAYEMSKVKSTATRVEGNQYKDRRERFGQPVAFDLDHKDIRAVWKICKSRLRRGMRQDGRLRAFQGFQFFINSKGHKHRMTTNGFSELMKIYREKV